jgi:hypothetical protein
VAGVVVVVVVVVLEDGGVWRMCDETARAAAFWATPMVVGARRAPGLRPPDMKPLYMSLYTRKLPVCVCSREHTALRQTHSTAAQRGPPPPPLGGSQIRRTVFAFLRWLAVETPERARMANSDLGIKNGNILVLEPQSLVVFNGQRHGATTEW